MFDIRHYNQMSTEPTPKPGHGPQSTTKDKPANKKPSTKRATIGERRQYDRARDQQPERKEANRRRTAENRKKRIALGLCVGCGKPAVPGQTRCAAVPGTTVRPTTEQSPSAKQWLNKPLPGQKTKPADSLQRQPRGLPGQQRLHHLRARQATRFRAGSGLREHSQHRHRRQARRLRYPGHPRILAVRQNRPIPRRQVGQRQAGRGSLRTHSLRKAAKRRRSTSCA